MEPPIKSHFEQLLEAIQVEKKEEINNNK